MLHNHWLSSGLEGRNFLVVHALFFLRTSNFSAGAEQSYIFFDQRLKNWTFLNDDSDDVEVFLEQI